MTVDREALKQRDGESWLAYGERLYALCGLDPDALDPYEWEEDALEAVAGRHDALLADYDQALRVAAEFRKMAHDLEAERDRLKDALSHAYADARALWGVERDQLRDFVESIAIVYEGQPLGAEARRALGKDE